jgi:hypothetical protein
MTTKKRNIFITKLAKGHFLTDWSEQFNLSDIVRQQGLRNEKSFILRPLSLSVILLIVIIPSSFLFFLFVLCESNKERAMQKQKHRVKKKLLDICFHTYTKPTYGAALYGRIMLLHPLQLVCLFWKTKQKL